MANLIKTILSLEAYQKVALFLVLLILISLVIRSKYTVYYPDNLPRVRENGRTRFSLKTRLAYYTDCEGLFKEAYNTYSKKGLTCLIPGIGFRDEIILPVGSLKWMSSQPESVLSVYQAFIEVDQAHYSAGSEKLLGDPWQGLMVRKDMNAVLEKLCGALNNELGVAFNERLGTDEEWREIKLYQTLRLVVAQASSRFTVGLPLCRNEEYLKASIRFGDQFVVNVGVASVMPRLLRPIVGSLIWIPQWMNLRAMRKHFAPLFAERMALFKNSEKLAEGEPQDHIQMMLRYASTERPDEFNLWDMTRRLAVANLGSFHQTSMGVTNLIFNILASDKEFNTIAVLRQEIGSVVGDEMGAWTKAMVAKLVKCDSVCKETFRLQSFANRSPIRAVMVDNLVTEDGIRLPKGGLVSMLLTAHVDDDVFPDADKFDPFRYSKLKEDGEANTSLVSLGERFLTFGYGKHACPGRFLLEFELKMILSHLLMNYDIELAAEHGGKRPASKWMAEAIVPPSGGKIRFRRRKM